jgi:hypothetical protein
MKNLLSSSSMRRFALVVLAGAQAVESLQLSVACAVPRRIGRVLPARGLRTPLMSLPSDEDLFAALRKRTEGGDDAPPPLGPDDVGADQMGPSEVVEYCMKSLKADPDGGCRALMSFAVKFDDGEPVDRLGQCARPRPRACAPSPGRGALSASRARARAPQGAARPLRRTRRAQRFLQPRGALRDTRAARGVEVHGRARLLGHVAEGGAEAARAPRRRELGGLLHQPHPRRRRRARRRARHAAQALADHVHLQAGWRVSRADPVDLQAGWRVSRATATRQLACVSWTRDGGASEIHRGAMLELAPRRAEDSCAQSAGRLPYCTLPANLMRCVELAWRSRCGSNSDAMGGAGECCRRRALWGHDSYCTVRQAQRHRHARGHRQPSRHSFQAGLSASAVGCAACAVVTVRQRDVNSMLRCSKSGRRSGHMPQIRDLPDVASRNNKYRFLEEYSCFYSTQCRYRCNGNGIYALFYISRITAPSRPRPGPGLRLGT